jgi:hypothetical protein
MTAETPLDPKSESVLEWQGKEISIVELEDPIQYVSVASFCRAFGLDVAVQRRRLNRNSWYAAYTRLVNAGTAGGPQASLCLRVDALPTFMLGIDLAQVPGEEDKKLFQAFMDESSAVLAEYWGVSEVGEMRFLREQVARMIAEYEMEEAGLGGEERLDQVELMVEQMHRDLEERLETMREIYAELRADYRSVARVVKPKKGDEPRLGDAEHKELLAEVKSRVDLLARLKIEYFREERPYPHIWNYINLSISGVTTYKDIPLRKYQEVVDWLDAEILTIENTFSSKDS